MNNLNDVVYVAGHSGMVGSAIVRRLSTLGYENILLKSHNDLDLLDQRAVFDFFSETKIDQVYLAAAKVGGIYANNTFSADFIFENLEIENNVLKAAHDNDVDRLTFLGSSCIYPKFADQPIDESQLLTGPLEATNEPYAIAKIAGIKLCESYRRQFGRDFRSVMPTNLYGPGDGYDVSNSHVVPALIRRFYEAVYAEDKEVVVWGSGTPRREFMHVDDMAAATVHIMEIEPEKYWSNVQPMTSHVNVGTGVDITIRELAETLSTVAGFGGRVVFDASKPDGTPRKLLDVSRLRALGWEASIGLEEGLRDAYDWFASHQGSYRGR